MGTQEDSGGDETFQIPSSLLFRPWLLPSSKCTATLAASLGGEREKGPVVFPLLLSENNPVGCGKEHKVPEIVGTS